MDTMGFIFLLYLAKIALTGLVCLLRIFFRTDARIERLKKKLLDTILFSDLISIFAFGMMELGSAFLLNTKSLNIHDGSTRSNLAMAIFGIGLSLTVLPYVYRILLKQNDMEKVLRTNKF